MTNKKDFSTPAGLRGPTSGPEAVNPTSLSVEQLARMLGVPTQKVQQHVDAGAPSGADGRLNLVHYVAWLNQRLVTTEAKTDGD